MATNNTQYCSLCCVRHPVGTKFTLVTTVDLQTRLEAQLLRPLKLNQKICSAWINPKSKLATYNPKRTRNPLLPPSITSNKPTPPTLTSYSLDGWKNAYYRLAKQFNTLMAAKQSKSKVIYNKKKQRHLNYYSILKQ